MQTDYKHQEKVESLLTKILAQLDAIRKMLEERLPAHRPGDKS